MTIAGLLMQGANYAANIHSPLVVLGAAVGLGMPLAAMTALALTWPTRRRGRWLAGAAFAVAATLFLALPPPVTARHGWLAILVTALMTLTYVAVATVYL